MNPLDDIRKLHTADRDLRKFGLTVGMVLALFGAWFSWRQKGFSSYFLWPGLTLMVVGAVFPRLLKWVYVAWMSLAFVMGYVVAHVILTLLFLLVITPIGWVARLAGKDFLSLRLDRRAASYWIPRRDGGKPARDYERQF